MKPVSAGIYARISSDADDDRLGVTRQVKDCTAEAKRRGWRVVDTYVDNDVSATRSKVRPEYRRMLADLEAGRITGMIVWDVDRLTRTPRELEDIIDLADRRGLSLASIGGEIDLSTPQGRMTARIKGSVARHEAEQMSRRIKRKLEEKAEAGTPHGFPAYGWRRLDVVDDQGRKIGSRDELDPEHAGAVREAARRLLAGESLRAIAADFNARGIEPPRCPPWSSTTLRQVLTRERNAGLRRHRGKVIGPGAWPPIYDPGTHDRVVALIADPSRRTSKGSTRRHLLTGLARCGRDGCEGTMVVNVGRMTGSGKRQRPAYVCKACYRVRRKQESVDELVEKTMIARLQRSDALAAIALGDPAEAERLRDEIAALEARLDRAADDFADDAITAAQLRRITARLRPQLERARQEKAKHEPSDVLAAMAGPDAAARWAAASLEAKRAVIDLLATVTIMPTGSGRDFDPQTVIVDWRSP